MIASLLIAALVYLLLQAAYIGALAPQNLTNPSSWLNPLGGHGGAYGPYAELATTLGIGWVATLIYIDAVISPGGKAMLYVGATSRLPIRCRGRGQPRVFSSVSTGGGRRGSVSPWPPR